jgi:hypothetical protein
METQREDEPQKNKSAVDSYDHLPLEPGDKKQASKRHLQNCECDGAIDHFKAFILS